MKFIHYLEKISGVSVYGLSSLLIFGSFFLVMSIWAFRADKNMMEELRRLPLDKASFFLVAAPLDGSNPFFVFAVIIMIILALAIALLANVLRGAAEIPVKPDAGADDKGQEGKEESLTYADGLARTGSPRSMAMLPFAAVVTGVSDTAFYMISCVIILEVLVVLVLLYNVKLILSIHKKRGVIDEVALAPVVPRVSWWHRLNRFKSREEEVALDLGHDYDGIRELDNSLPPWWLYGFYCTILFSCVYLWRYHVSHSAPLSEEEYTIAVQKAEVQRAAYLKKAANLVDENTVKRLTGDGDLAAGRKVFETTCFACHGKAGEGGVGPNLTDEYWLHGGSVQDIFKSIKYGWPDKGMKSWKDDLSPSQIAQIASYVTSLQATHPANAKAPQGTVFK